MDAVLQLARYIAFDQSIGALSSSSTDGGPCMVLAVWALAYRAFALRRARRLIIADRARYDVAWEAAAEGLEGQRALEELGNAAREAASTRVPRRIIHDPCSGGDVVVGSFSVIGSVLKPRQLVLKPIAAPHAAGSDNATQAPARSLLRRVSRMDSWSERSVNNQRAPLTNLDVLYVQAVLLHPILAHKALDWAMESRGWFPRVKQDPPGDGLDLLICPAEEPDQVCAIQWAQVKRVARAYEKMQRSYHAVCCTSKLYAAAFDEQR
jgi:hypothetical protein